MKATRPLRCAAAGWLPVVTATLALGLMTRVGLEAQTADQFPQVMTCVALPPGADTWPAAATDSLSTVTGSPVTVSGATLLANDRGTWLKVEKVGPASTAGGVVTGTDPYTFTVAPGFTGTDVFPYEIRDDAGRTTIGLVHVTATAAADTIMPVVGVTSPGAGATVAGTVLVSATASDNVAVAGVRFFAGAALIGAEVTAAPFTTPWDTTGVANGSHSLTAVARDTAGNSQTSAAVAVTVSNVVAVSVPAIVGLTSAAAQAAITQAGLQVGTITNAYSSSVAVGLVISESPSAGQSVSPNSLISFVVSLGVQPPPTGGLVLALSFNEASGTAVSDSSGLANHGTISGPTRIPGQAGFGYALAFDGTDDWVTVADAASLDLTAGMTIEAWVRPTSVTGWETVALKERGTGDMAYSLYAVDGTAALGGGNGPAAYGTIGGVHRSVRQAAAIPLNTWTHLAATYDGITQRLYLNGVNVASRAQTGNLVVSAGALRIGGNNAWDGEFFAGQIDEVRIYNRALATAEIVLDMNSPLSADAAPTVSVPGVVGGTQLAAQSAIMAAGLTIGSIGDGYHASIAAGSVISQNPVANTPVLPGSAVSLVVSLGPPPPADGPILALSFNEVGGTVATDASGHGNHGTVSGATRVAGRAGSGTALLFDGVDDWVTVADAATLDLTTAVTIEAWVNPALVDGWETVVLKERGTGNLAYALYSADGTPALGGVDGPAGYASIGGIDHAVRRTAGLPLGTWTHVAVTYDGTTQRLYVNGALATSRAQAGSLAVSNSPLRIGGNAAWAGEFFQGLIDDVRVYGRALSATEIATDMNTPVP